MMQSITCKKCCEKVNFLVKYLLARARTFSILDFAIFKTCLVCFGAFIATVFSKQAKKFKFLLFIGFLASWVYLIWRLFFQDDTTNQNE